MKKKCRRLLIVLFSMIAVVFVDAGYGREGKPSGFYIEQALVHRIQPPTKTSAYPVIMIPGANLSSYIYLTTPDGRDGWAQQFAVAGYEVYVINDPKFDFSRGFSVAGFEDVPAKGAPPANPDARRGWSQDVWRRWGFGASKGNPYPNSRFPAENFTRFEENYPYLSTGHGATFAESVRALLERVGSAILLAHSAGGPRAVSTALARPELVAGMVLVEPTGPPGEGDFPALAGISMLGVYGDKIQSRRQSGRKSATEAAAELFAQNGGVGEIISLPDDHGVDGNSHLMMQDRNSDFISGLIIAWLNKHAKTPPPGGGGGEVVGTVAGGGEKTGSGRKRGGGGGGGMAAQVFAQLDTNEDGSLSIDEFGKGRRYRSVSAPEILEAFKAVDADENDAISSGEFAGSFGGAGRGGRRRGGTD